MLLSNKYSQYVIICLLSSFEYDTLDQRYTMKNNCDLLFRSTVYNEEQLQSTVTANVRTATIRTPQTLVFLRASCTLIAKNKLIFY